MLRRVFLSFIFLLFVSISFAQSRRIGLVLGGGGAKGAATIGALKVIERAGIKPDYIAGTSIGAIIGGLYASGYTAKELEDLFLSQEWQDILQGHLVKKQIETLLRAKGVVNFSDTRIPFRCVATEKWNLEEVDFSSGNLAIAIRASMSIPELYESVFIDDMELVDGGMVNNLPVDVVKAMGAKVVIAVDLEQGDDVSLGISIGGGVLGWALSRPDVSRYQINLEDVNIHIHPVLPDYTAMSFGRANCEHMMKLGEEEAQSHWRELIALKR